MTPTPRQLPAISTATFPPTYAQAKDALARCQRLDEAKGWEDRAAAMAAYARMAQDEHLHKLATRVRVWAQKRYGEMLKAIPPEPGKGGGRPTNGKPRTAKTRGSSARTKAARKAGITPKQQKLALKLADIPEDEFKKAVDDSDKPPTAAALAKRATKNRAIDIRPDIPPDLVPAISAAARVVGHVTMTTERLRKERPAEVARGVRFHPQSLITMRRVLPDLIAWLTELQRSLEAKQ